MAQPDTAGAAAPFDPEADSRALARTLAGSAELDALVSQISVYEPQSILRFGQEAAARIARCSDEVLHSVSAAQVHDTGALLDTLARVMGQFDPDEIAGEERPGVLARLRGRKSSPEACIDKYRTMGGEVDKIYVELKRYEAEIQDGNRGLQAILDANIAAYRALIRYILAGEQGLTELDAYLAQLAAEQAARPGDALLQMDLASARQARTLLDRRVQDLRTAKVVALQAIPMVQMMQHNNLNLVQKINTAFLVTLPVFKQALAQAVYLKRQRIQAQAMRALEDRTRALVQKNAQAAAVLAQKAGANPDDPELLERTVRTIVSGIQETQALQAGAEAQRNAGAARLGELRQTLQAGG